jgi:hypothetical protein
MAYQRLRGPAPRPVERQPEPAPSNATPARRAVSTGALGHDFAGIIVDDRRPATGAGVVQGYFVGPSESVIGMVHAYVKSERRDKLKEFERRDNDRDSEYDLYDFVADELQVEMHAIYDWDEQRDANEKEQPSFEQLLASFQADVEYARQLAGLPMTGLLRRAFEESGIPKKQLKDLRLFNMLLDIGQTELQQMSLDDKVQKLPDYYKNWLAYTSCHNTAVKLISRMAAGPGALGGYTGRDKAAAAAEKAGDWLASASGALSAAISSDIAQQKRSIYEVHCGGHGFAIIVRNAQAEIVQSFANAVALVERMVRGPLILKDGEIQEVVRFLASATTGERDRAAQVVADCNAEVFGLEPYPSFQYRWRRAELLSDAALLEYFTTELRGAYNAIKGLMKTW